MSYQKKPSEPYSLRCTECGSEVRNKRFRIDALLKKYYYPGMDRSELERLIAFLGITVPFGEAVLPSASPLIALNGQTMAPDPVFVPYDSSRLSAVREPKQNLLFADYDEKQIPDTFFREVSLTIEAIVAAFVRMTGFVEFYALLKLYYEDHDRNRYNELADKFSQLPQVHLGDMGNTESARMEIGAHLDFILRSAEAQAESGQRESFSLEKTVSAVWVQRKLNGRDMPYALAFSADGKQSRCNECLCPECGTAMPWEFGAYRQKIVGILGVQSSGKTSYMSALLDAIDRGEATTKVVQTDTYRTPYTIDHSMVGDVQWNRLRKQPEEKDQNAGSLWLYQHGYEAVKTRAANATETALSNAPSFLVVPEAAEPVMYTLADIPGEAFDGYHTGEFSQDTIRKNQQLLFHADSIFLIVNASQTAEESVKETNDRGKLSEAAHDPQRVLASYKEFLPDRQIPVGIILTAADKINGGRLRTPLHLAFDLRLVPPLIRSEPDKLLVYNAELMATVMKAANNFVDTRYGNFFSTLRANASERWHAENPAVASFVCSSGTQKSIPRSADRESDEQEEKERYRDVKKAAFGVTAPLLWLLALDGFLPLGHPDHRFTKYSDRTKAQMQGALSTLLIP